MTANLLATPADVADIWRPLTAEENQRAANLINKASALLKHAAPFDLAERIGYFTTDPTNKLALDPTLVASVVAGIVKRAMVNPDGVVSKSETTGPYTNSATYGDAAAGAVVTVGLVVTDDDLAQLRPPHGFAEPFTIRTHPPSHCQ